MKMISENEVRKLVRDYLNEDVTKKELLLQLDLEECDCGNIELKEDMVYHKHDLAQSEDKICPDCKENE